MIGSSLAHFRITEKLGEGGMGEVYLATDTRLDRQVALKILPDEVAGDADRRGRFEAEARAASAINHSNITAIYDVGEDGGVHYIVMEFVDGDDLSARMATSALDEREIVRIGEQVADALAEAHAVGITHRDIKPANVMVTPRGQVKVLDFGLAKLRSTEGDPMDEGAPTQTMTQPGVVMGTVRYMSPEQALGKSLDARSDIFSFGIVLYELTTGQAPFVGETSAETITKISRDEPVPIRELNNGISAELERIIRKCLEKDPNRRYQSARELAVDLRNLTRDGESGATAQVEISRSRPKNATILAAAVAVMIVIAGVSVLVDRAGSDDRSVQSIAVLPFENGTGGDEIEYLCDGLAEGLIHSLARIPDLEVISRRSSWVFKDSTDDLQTIGEKLGVDALVLGRMSVRGDGLAVSAELVDVRDSHQLWGGRYTRSDNDVLGIEQELATTIAETLKLELSGETAVELARRFEVDPEAHNLYLQGRRFAVGSATEMAKAVDYFERAIEKDPNYALPWAGLADVYITQSHHGVLDQEEASTKSRAAVARALEIDDGLAEALAASAEIKYLFEWDWAGADEDLRRAIETNPGSDFARKAYAYYLSAVGRFDEAIEQASIAKDLDPLSPSAFHLVAFASMGKHDYTRAAAEFRAALDLNPNWTWGYIKLAKTYADSDQCEEAFSTAEAAEAELHGGGTPLARSWLGYTYAKCGDTRRTDETLATLDGYAEDRYVDPVVYAIVYAGMGDMERLLAELERSIDDHSINAVYAPVTPAYYMSSLADDPRFQELLVRLGFTQSSASKGGAG
jgi:serine/threonine protein kinase/tetratricopeptide (TPR) repeat protein